MVSSIAGISMYLIEVQLIVRIWAAAPRAPHKRTCTWHFSGKLEALKRSLSWLRRCFHARQSPKRYPTEMGDHWNSLVCGEAHQGGGNQAAKWSCDSGNLSPHSTAQVPLTPHEAAMTRFTDSRIKMVVHATWSPLMKYWCLFEEALSWTPGCPLIPGWITACFLAMLSHYQCSQVSWSLVSDVCRNRQYS